MQTIGAAWQDATQRLCPDFDVEEDCVLDIVEERDGTFRLVLSDVSVGGGGLIEALAGRISEDPRRFDHLVVAALETSDLEEADRSLRTTLSLLENDPEVATCGDRFRSATAGRIGLWRSLLTTLARHGVSTSHATVASLAERLFRPGSSPASDQAFRRCLMRWDEVEQIAGFAFDHRTACAVLAEDEAVVDALRLAVPDGHAIDRGWRQSVLLGLLWVPAEARRPTSLEATNRFVEDPPLSERTLVLDSLGDVVDGVDVDEAGWFDVVTERIGRVGRCRVFSGSDDPLHLKIALSHLAVQAVELGSLLVFPRLEGLRRDDRGVQAEFSLEEAPQ